MSKNVVKSDASGKKGILSCWKSLFEKIGINQFGSLQPENPQNVQKWVFGEKLWESIVNGVKYFLHNALSICNVCNCFLFCFASDTR